MTLFWIILLSFSALIALLLSLKVSLSIEYTDEPVLFWQVLFIKKRAFSGKEKKRRRRSMGKREAERIKRKLQKESEKKRREQKEKEVYKKKKGSVSGILSTINLAAEMVKKMLSLFSKHLKIKVARIRINIGTEDAATTAIEYGAVTQAINILFPLLEQIDNFSVSKHADISVTADFTAQESEADIRVSLSLRVWQIIKIALSALFSAIKHQFNDLKGKE